MYAAYMKQLHSMLTSTHNNQSKDSKASTTQDTADYNSNYNDFIPIPNANNQISLHTPFTTVKGSKPKTKQQNKTESNPEQEKKDQYYIKDVEGKSHSFTKRSKPKALQVEVSKNKKKSSKTWITSVIYCLSFLPPVQELCIKSSLQEEYDFGPNEIQQHITYSLQQTIQNIWSDTASNQKNEVQVNTIIKLIKQRKTKTREQLLDDLLQNKNLSMVFFGHLMKIDTSKKKREESTDAIPIPILASLSEDENENTSLNLIRKALRINEGYKIYSAPECIVLSINRHCNDESYSTMEVIPDKRISICNIEGHFIDYTINSVVLQRASSKECSLIAKDGEKWWRIDNKAITAAKDDLWEKELDQIMMIWYIKTGISKDSDNSNATPDTQQKEAEVKEEKRLSKEQDIRKEDLKVEAVKQQVEQIKKEAESKEVKQSKEPESEKEEVQQNKEQEMKKEAPKAKVFEVVCEMEGGKQGKANIVKNGGVSWEEWKELVKTKLKRYLKGREIEDIVTRDSDGDETVVDEVNIDNMQDGTVLYIISEAK